MKGTSGVGKLNPPMLVETAQPPVEQEMSVAAPHQCAYLHHLCVACVSCAHVFIRGVLHRALHHRSHQYIGMSLNNLDSTASRKHVPKMTGGLCTAEAYWKGLWGVHLCIADLGGNHPWHPLEQQLWAPKAAPSKRGFVQVGGLHAFWYKSILMTMRPCLSSCSSLWQAQHPPCLQVAASARDINPAHSAQSPQLPYYTHSEPGRQGTLERHQVKTAAFDCIS